MSTEFVVCPKCRTYWRCAPPAWAIRKPGDCCGDYSQGQAHPCTGRLVLSTIRGKAMQHTYKRVPARSTTARKKT